MLCMCSLIYEGITYVLRVDHAVTKPFGFGLESGA